MEIRIAGIVNDSIVDGPGLRLAVFTQGCPHHCPMCHNPETHDYQGGTVQDTDDIIRLIHENPLLDGITLSGGEPFTQPQACAQIAREAHAAGLNVWCYSGFTVEKLMEYDEPGWKELLASIDVLVDGPFVYEQRTLNKRFRGSSNQRILNIPETLIHKAAVLSEYN